MEGQAERLVSLLSALIVEEVVDDVVTDREEGAAGRVGRGVLAVGARDAAGERSCSAVFCQKTLPTPQMSFNPTAGTLDGGDDGDDGEKSLESHCWRNR